MLYDFEATGSVFSREPELPEAVQKGKGSQANQGKTLVKAHQQQTVCRELDYGIEFYW